MKQEFKQLALTVALALLMGCAFTAQAQIATDSVLIIKNRGIAGIRIGMKMSKVPKSIPGLYNDYMEDYGCEAGVSYWCNVTVPGEDNYLVFNDEDENGLIDGIDVQVIGARIADTEIVIGKPLSEILNTPGLVKKKVGEEDFESVDYIYKGTYHIQSGFLGDNTVETVTSINWGLH